MFTYSAIESYLSGICHLHIVIGTVSLYDDGVTQHALAVCNKEDKEYWYIYHIKSVTVCRPLFRYLSALNCADKRSRQTSYLGLRWDVQQVLARANQTVQYFLLLPLPLVKHALPVVALCLLKGLRKTNT